MGRALLLWFGPNPEVPHTQAVTLSQAQPPRTDDPDEMEY